MIFNCKYCKTDVICNNDKNVCTKCEAIIVKCQFCDDYVFCDTDEQYCYLCRKVFCQVCVDNRELVYESLAYDCCANKIECLKRKEKLLCICPFCNDGLLNYVAHCEICDLLFCSNNCFFNKKFVIITSSGCICANKTECLNRKRTL